MARLLGVEIPDNKRTIIGLTSIHGIGKKTSGVILSKSKIDPDKKFGKLNTEEVKTILEELENYKIEGALKSQVMLNIKRKKDMDSYQGIRHRAGHLTVRGQRTKNNGRTKKGPKKNAIKKNRRRY